MTKRNTEIQTECAQCDIDRAAGEITIHYHPQPTHCGRPMLAVEDRNVESPTFNKRIWWCADCHAKVLRETD